MMDELEMALLIIMVAGYAAALSRAIALVLLVTVGSF